ncbi:MAG: Ni/Fe-hydrogenase, b-type cytochrome subunit [Actinomycetia bacterium]|nr:Ni/Fe-hydrogenase, b-type cytochrome subunit [Actinomycetes bacterium]
MTPVAAARTGVEPPPLSVGTAYSLGAMSEGRIMALAAASAPGDDDPVTRGVIAALEEDYPKLAAPQAAPEDVEPARLDRRYTLTRVRAYRQPDGSTADVVVMRGDLDAVMRVAKPTREHRTLLRRNGDYVTQRGWRPLAVAQAEVAPDGTVGPFALLGFVAVCPVTVRETTGDVSTGPATWARVNVWSSSLRVQHWANVTLIFILSCTGYYIMDPFFGPTATPGTQLDTGFLMGWVRLIHFGAAFCWLVLALTRVWQLFTSRDRHLRWPSMWPLKSKEDVRNLGRTLKHYVFISEHAPTYLFHNPLQQLTYTSVYVVCTLQMVVGFCLFGLYRQNSPFWAFISTPIHWIGVPYVRLLHTLIMFALWVFVIAHVYLVFRSESLERHGGLSAMISGGVWVRRGATPVDAPTVE